MNRMYEFLKLISENLQDIVGWTRSMVMAFLTVMLNFFTPLYDFFYVIIGLATIDIIAGLLADHGNWKKRKAIKAFIYLCLFFCVVLTSYAVGIVMRQGLDSMVAFSSWLTWVMIWFYATNILRNLHIRFPESKYIAFLYWVATVKFISKINFLEEFQANKQKEENKQ